MLGRQIGHYRLIEKLGAGGMGEVYKAEDCRLHRLIALKILSPERASQPSNLQRFQKEARSVAALNHPNIVTIYSVEQHEGLHFLTMELVEGKTLTDIIPPDGMSLRGLIEIALPLAEALEAAHERGIVHRDLKPDNVMISREGRVKVLDFGIAKGTADQDATWVEGNEMEQELLTGIGVAVGTPAYMAPEQVLGASVDHRTDLFAFGVVLFQMATGRHPFRRRESKETMGAILRDTPPPPSGINPRIPVEIDALVARCLQKDISQRMQSAADLRERLQGFFVGMAAGSSPSRPLLEQAPVPVPVRQFRWPQPAMLLALAASVVLALTVGWARFSVNAGRVASAPIAPLAFAEANGNQRPSLAVLPLGNFSNDPEYFVDGMTDSLISSLADVRGVRVISRQSVMRYKGSSRPLPQIAGELGVSLVVQGSVLRVGNRVRITAQLIRAAPEQQLWARSYERDLRDVLTLQKEVAEAITQEIRVKIEPEDRRHLATGRLVDPQAYDAYLRGRYAWNRRTNESVVQSLQSFQEALDRDPQLALAHAGLAAAYAWAGGREVLSPEESFRKARQHAKAALEIDPGLADAHASLGYVQMRADRDWQGAEASFRRAIALQPNHAAAHFFYWVYLFARGRQPEAREQIRLAAELDPLSTIVTINLGLADLLDGNEAEALRLWKKAQMLDPDLPSTYVYLSSYYLQKGELEMSRQSFRKVLALRYAEIVPQMNQASRAGGDKAALKAAVKALEDLSRRRPVPSEDIAWVYLLLGQRGKALDWLEKAYEQNSPATIFFRNDWTWRSLRSEPRFQALIKKIG